MPTGIQRRRAKGWRLPENAVIVDRTTPWGNPFVAGRDGNAEFCVKLYEYLMVGGLVCLTCKAEPEDQMKARKYTLRNLHRLRGKDLCCWCRLDRACHRNVLLRMASALPEKAA